MNINEIFERFSALNVLLVGDVMIDAYQFGSVSRISPEAPVAVFDFESEEKRLGGAANVLLNLKSLGANPILCSVIGQDDAAVDFLALLDKHKLSTASILQDPKRKTTCKTRVLANNQQLLRIDREDHFDIDAQMAQSLIAEITRLCDTQKIDVILLEDYNKGVLTEKTISAILELAQARHIPTAVDPKKNNFFAYQKATLFKPNLKELKEGLQVDINKHDVQSIQKAIALLQERLGNQKTLLTLSEQGVILSEADKFIQLPAHIRNIADVSGAGDTVISVATLCLALGLDNTTLASWSNLAGGLVCEQLGVVPIDKEQLKAEIMRYEKAKFQ